MRARATEHALGHEMHVPVLAEAYRPRAPTSVAWIPPPTRAGRRHRGTHTWMASFSVEHTFNIVNVSRMIVCPRLLLSSILCADKITARYNSLLLMHKLAFQQSFKTGGRGRSQIVETRQGSKIDRREGEGGERRARLGKGVRGKRRVFS